LRNKSIGKVLRFGSVFKNNSHKCSTRCDDSPDPSQNKLGVTSARGFEFGQFFSSRKLGEHLSFQPRLFKRHAGTMRNIPLQSGKLQGGASCKHALIRPRRRVVIFIGFGVAHA